MFMASNSTCTSAMTVPLGKTCGESSHSADANCPGSGFSVLFQAGVQLRVWLKRVGPVIQWKDVEPTIMCVRPSPSTKARAGMSGVSFTLHLCRLSTEAHTVIGTEVGSTVIAATAAHTENTR
jgi:hypothetical protein